jgi:hypothetical protein
MANAKKAREYIEKRRRMFRSPVELQQDVETRYGTDAEVKVSFQEARDLYDEALGWANSHDIAMQDYWAEQCGYAFQWDEENPKPIIRKVLGALKEMADHLKRGRELELNDLEQQVIDTLWGWVPHDYPENYVACAREVSKAIVRLLPPEREDKSEEEYVAYYKKVIAEVKQLAQRHDVDFDTSDYNLSAGYFYEWLSDEYGIIFDDAGDREV